MSPTINNVVALRLFLIVLMVLFRNVVNIPNKGSIMNFFNEKNVENALQSFNQMPHAVWWKDRDLVYRLMNNQTAKTLGYKNSHISYEGVLEHDIPCPASDLADEFCRQDQFVIRTGKPLSMICFCEYANNDWVVFLGHKYCFKNDQQENIGMGGTAVDITDCKVMRSALLLLSDDDQLIGRKLNELNQFTYMLKDRYDDFDLNLRESEILFLMIRGKSAKEIAKRINLSHRTIEKYIEIMKAKLRCASKSELVEKAIQSGAGSIIPKSIVKETQS